MPSLTLTRLAVACCVLSTSACADILGLGDFSFGDGGSTSTSTSTGGSAGDGGNGAAASDGGAGGTPPMSGGMSNIGGNGGSGGSLVCDGDLSYEDVVKCDEPVLYLRFEDPPNSAMTNSTPGSVPDGSYSADAQFTQGVPGIGGNALEQHAGRSEVPDPEGVLYFAPSDAYSVEAWVLAPNNSNDTFAFIGTWDGGEQGHALFVFPESMAAGTQMNLEVKRNTATEVLLCSSFPACSLQAGSFHHVVATYSPGVAVMTLYLDGAPVGEAGLKNELAQPQNAFAISGPVSEFVVFDEVAVYDYVLTPRQVAAHFACSTGDC